MLAVLPAVITVEYSLVAKVRNPVVANEVTKPVPTPVSEVSPSTSGRMLMVVVAAAPPPPMRFVVVAVKVDTPAPTVPPRLGPRSKRVAPAVAPENVPTVKASPWAAFVSMFRTLPPVASENVLVVSVVEAPAFPRILSVPPFSTMVPMAELTEPPRRLLTLAPELSRVRMPAVRIVVVPKRLLPEPL